MRRYSIVLLMSFIWLYIGSLTQVHAADWEEVLQLDIVSREEWGADETWRRASSFGIPIDPSPISGKTLAIYQYLLDHFPAEQAIDSVESYEDGHELHRPRSYKAQKNAIVVHHTASDPQRIQEQGGVVPHLQHIYKYHTFTRGRGDIGYHFLIDQDGVIYEGRAGGPDVIAAHTKRNNSMAIGISLIGNFQEEHPSPAMVESLTRLATQIAIYYHIDPQQLIDVHKETSTDPYVTESRTHAVLGHRDAGHTTCPGDHVYALLPSLREDIALGIFAQEHDGGVGAVLTDLPLQSISGVVGDSDRLSVLGEATSMQSGELECRRVEGLGDEVPLEIHSCSLEEGILDVNVTVVSDYVSGGYPLLVRQGSYSEIWYIRTVRTDALRALRAERRASFDGQLPHSPRAMEKIADHISLDRARTIVKGSIRVFLHDASQSNMTDTLSCEHSCTLTIRDVSSSAAHAGSGDRILTHVGSMDITDYGERVGVALGSEVEFFGSSIHVHDDNDGWVSIDTYDRTSYAGLPRNRFQGEISVQKDEYLDIDTGVWSEGYIFINTLDFRDYLYGLGEAAVQDPLAKQHVLALLTKTYAVYYMSEKNPHPSMDVSGHSVSYDAIDDPRAFQKYVGVGRLDVYPAWQTIVDEMWDTRVLYDDYIPILPYFNCSPGLTWSAAEKRGWTDTPRLTSVLDFGVVGCDDFAGHGVGLSGKGATYMAQNDISYSDILEYYYHGIEIVE